MASSYPKLPAVNHHAELGIQMRHSALNHAVNDFARDVHVPSAEKVVERAQAYYDFLIYVKEEK